MSDGGVLYLRERTSSVYMWVWKIGLYKVEFSWLCVVYVIMFWNGRKESDGFFKSDLVYLLTLEMTQMQRLEFHVSQDIRSCLAKSEGML